MVPQGKNQCRLYRSGHESAQVICAGERGELNDGDRLVLGKKDDPRRSVKLRRVKGVESQPEEEEQATRPDPEDGELRTRAQFASKFGGLVEWEDAETRLDPMDLMPYTKAQFIETYGGTIEWMQAGEPLAIRELEGEVTHLKAQLETFDRDKAAHAEAREFRLAAQAKKNSDQAFEKLREKEVQLEAKVAAADAAANAAAATTEQMLAAGTGVIAEAMAEPEPVTDTLAAEAEAEAEPGPEPEPEPELEPEPEPESPVELRPERLGPRSKWKVVMSGRLNVRTRPALNASTNDPPFAFSQTRSIHTSNPFVLCQQAASAGSKKEDAVVECFEIQDEWLRISPDGEKQRWVRAWSKDGRAFLQCIDPGIVETEPEPEPEPEPEAEPDSKQHRFAPPRAAATLGLWEVNLSPEGAAPSWKRYDELVQQMLQQQVQAGATSITVQIGPHSYFIDTEACVQRNTETQMERPIRRLEVAAASATSRSAEAKKPCKVCKAKPADAPGGLFCGARCASTELDREITFYNPCGRGSDAWTYANTLLMSTWTTREKYAPPTSELLVKKLIACGVGTSSRVW